MRIALACAVLCILAAFARQPLGNVPRETAGQSLQVFRVSQPLPNFQPRAGLAAVPASWLDTAAGVVVFAGEVAQASMPKGPLWPLLVIWVAVGIWLLLAYLGEWRRPSPGWALLISLQLFGATYYLCSFRSPSRRIVTPFTAFDFHAHTTRSNGLLTPQQQINWHRARGFNGLAFTDSNTVMPENELKVLRAANPDMLLLSGSEYHSRDAHLIFLGLRSPITPRGYDVPAAIRAARQQGAIVIVPHPWYPAKFTPQQFLTMGVDGFEAWNGIIWDRQLARLVRDDRLVGTTATDTLSKSGSRCYTWTLIPRGMTDTNKVMRALRLRKTAAAFALSNDQTPTAYEELQRRQKSPLFLFQALRTAWGTLTGAQRVTTLLGLIGIIAALWAWGAEGVAKTPDLQGPKTAVGFLRRRRLGPRLFGVLCILLAFGGSIAIGVLTMGNALKSPALLHIFTPTPAHAILVWLLCDALFYYGRSQWRRTH